MSLFVIASNVKNLISSSHCLQISIYSPSNVGLIIIFGFFYLAIVYKIVRCLSVLVEQSMASVCDVEMRRERDDGWGDVNVRDECCNFYDAGSVRHKTSWPH